MPTLADVKVYPARPAGFEPEVEIGAAFVEVNGKLLLMQNARNEVGLWGVPAGKLEKGETPLDGTLRELFEEAGIRPGKDVQSAGSLYIKKPHIQYIFHMFRIALDEEPVVQMSDEHTAYVWQPLERANELPLMQAAPEALRYYCLSLA